MDTELPKVVVLGAGFGGLEFCKAFPNGLAKLTLIDRQNHHLFQPLLYQVATAGLSATDIAQPIRSILTRKPDLTVLMAEVTGFDLAAKQVLLNPGEVSFDYLVLALGGITSYFGHPEWEEYAPGLKSIDDALKIRRQILMAFERAEMEPDPARVKELMTTVIVGGGPTGVEMAGAIAELARTVLRKDFDLIDPAKARVILIEGNGRVLTAFPPELSEKAERQLQQLGVEVRTQTRVKDIRAGEVDLGTEIIRAGSIIWAAGVSATPITSKLGVEIDRGGRVKVAPDASLPGHPNVFAIGDMAALVDANGVAVPGVSPSAIQMGQYVAGLIAAELRVKHGVPGAKPAERKPFVYRDKGMMATIGRSKAVAMLGKWRFSGYLAWFTWLFVHLVFLVGLRNKFSVFFQWTYSYFTFRRGARIITGLSGEKSAGSA